MVTKYQQKSFETICIGALASIKISVFQKYLLLYHCCSSHRPYYLLQRLVLNSQNKAKEVGPSAITSSALFGVYEDITNSQLQRVLSSTPVLPLLRGHLALLGEAVTYRPYRLRHALFGCKALICRCNCIGFKTSQISNNTTAYFKCQHFALFLQQGQATYGLFNIIFIQASKTMLFFW